GRGIGGLRPDGPVHCTGCRNDGPRRLGVTAGRKDPSSCESLGSPNNDNDRADFCQGSPYPSRPSTACHIGHVGGGNAWPSLSVGGHREAEREFFGLELESSHLKGAFTLTNALVNPQGHFYGGAGVAVAVAMMEAATNRRALWTTLQFLATAFRGARLE